MPAGQEQDRGAPEIDLGGLLSGIDPSMLMRATKAMSRLQNTSDDRAALLLALKPFLRKGRRERVDEAIRILQMMRMAELFRKEMD